MKMDVEDSCGIKIKEEAKECLSPTSTTHATCVTGANNAPNTTPTIINHTPTLKLTPTTNNNPEPSPVNLNLKPRSKGSNQPPKDRQPEEGVSPLTTDTRAASPGPQRASTTSASSLSRSTAMHDACRTGGSRSSDSNSPLPQPTKLENGDTTNGRVLTVNVAHEETSGPASNDIGQSTASGNRVPHAKIKRLLGTLVQFASDISTETGDTVRSLVLSLLSGAMNAEEFHAALQDATNFPLRGFVLPYLKHTLPALQRDLTNAARANNQTSMQYLRSIEATVLEAAGFSPGEADEVFGERNNAGSSSTCVFPSYNISANAGGGSANSKNANNTGASNNPAGQTSVIHGGNQQPNSTSLHHYPGPPPPPPSHPLKRRASDTPYYESGPGPLFDDGPLYGKRSINPWASHHPLHHQRQQQQQQQQQQQPPDPYGWYHSLHLQGGGQASIQSHPQTSMPPSLVQINHLAASSTISSAPHLVHQQPWAVSGSGQGTSGLQNGSGTAATAALDDEWKYIHVMLNCILGMVKKTKRALAILQQRGCPSPATPTTTVATTSGTNSQNNGPTMTTGSQSADATGNERDNSLKRISGEIVAQTIRATEDRVAEVQRRAEEAMLEAKRAAVAEVQQAIAAAAAESRAAERLRVHHRFFEPPIQRSHGHPIPHGHSHGPLLRIVDTTCSATTATTTATTTTASNAMGARERDDEKESHPLPGSSCWNCGRQALETCGGCGIARYCGPFCQHRDWEAGGHYASCNQRRSTPPPPPPLPPPPLPRPASRSPTTSNSGPVVTSGGTSGTCSNVTPSMSGTGHSAKGK